MIYSSMLLAQGTKMTGTTGSTIMLVSMVPVETAMILVVLAAVSM